MRGESTSRVPLDVPWVLDNRIVSDVRGTITSIRPPRRKTGEDEGLRPFRGYRKVDKKLPKCTPIGREEREILRVTRQIYRESARLVLSKFNRYYLYILYVTNVNIAAHSESILWHGGICDNILGKKNHMIYFRRRVKYVHVKIYVCWWNFF